MVDVVSLLFGMYEVMKSRLIGNEPTAGHHVEKTDYDKAGSDCQQDQDNANGINW